MEGGDQVLKAVIRITRIREGNWFENQMIDLSTLEGCKHGVGKVKGRSVHYGNGPHARCWMMGPMAMTERGIVR